MLDALDAIHTLLDGQPVVSPALNTTLDLLTVGLIIARADGEMVFNNKMGAKLLGLGVSERSTDEWSAEYGVFYGPGQALVPPEKLPLVRALGGDSINAVRLFVRNPNLPQGMWLDCASHPLLGANGQQTGATVIFQPLPDEAIPDEQVAGIFTQRLDAIEAEGLSEEDTVLRLLERSTDGIWDWNVLTGADYFSPRWKEVLGYGPEDDLPHTVETWQSKVHPEDLPKAYAAVKAHFEKGEPYDIVLRYWKKDGSIAWIRTRGEGLQDDSGRWVRMLGTHTDLTPARTAATALRKSEAKYRALSAELEIRVAERTVELARRNTELQEKNQELEQFAYVASHDLQEPLRKIISFAPLLEEELDGQLSERGEKYLSIMTDAAQRMRQLIRDLLSYSRAGQFDTDNQTCSAADCIQLALDNLSEAIPRPAEQVTLEGDFGTYPCAAPHLTQVFQNLLGNAAKYHSPERPMRITVTGTRTADTVQLAVSDNGIGIEARYHERIFEVFQRLHPRQRYSGTGIGLALCRRIVAKYAGQIAVASTPGEGSTFTITLPLSPTGRE